MNVLLYSWGPWKNKQLETAFMENLKKNPKENKLFILSIDTKSDFHVKHLGIAKEWYKTIGFTEENIHIYNLQTDKIPNFDALDVLHIWGGNTFHYMKRINELGLEKEIREYIARDGLYLGSSAGAMIMCPDIDENLTNDPNDSGLEYVKGFGLVDFYLLVHWDSRGDELHTSFIENSWKSGKKAIALTDNQAIHVNNESFKIISP